MPEPTYPLHLWRWRVADPLRPGRLYLTRHHMSEAEAMARHPGAVKEVGTLRVVEKPETAHGSPDYGLPELYNSCRTK